MRNSLKFSVTKVMAIKFLKLASGVEQGLSEKFIPSDSNLEVRKLIQDLDFLTLYTKQICSSDVKYVNIETKKLTSEAGSRPTESSRCNFFLPYVTFQFEILTNLN